MANPFLAMNEDFSSVPQNPALNPFLSDDFGENEPYTDNPFTASNPFSDFGTTTYNTDVTVTSGIDIFGFSQPSTVSSVDHFSTTINNVYDNQTNEPLFSTAPTIDTNTVTATNFFETTTQSQTPDVINIQHIQKPTDLDLSTMNTVSDNDSSQYISDEESIDKPKRPPPPRPINSETKNLILSVTGHMELTSSHLLDRIPPTRTPSPVSMRDLHSPSPTPDHTFNDFLIDGEQKKDLISTEDNEVNMFDVDDVVTQYSCSPQQNSSPAAEVDILSSNKSLVDTSNVVISTQEPSPKEELTTNETIHKPPRPGPPSRPTPPVRPARPTPPQKPPPPNVTPHRPPPPAVPPPPSTHRSSENNTFNNDFSLFDAPVPQPLNKPTTKEDILSLYSAPKKQEEPVKQIDFLMDDIDVIENVSSNEFVPSKETNPETISENIINDLPDQSTPMETPPFEIISSTTESMAVDVENSNVSEEIPAPPENITPPSEIIPQENFNDSFVTQPILTESISEIEPSPLFSSEEMVNPVMSFHNNELPTDSNPFVTENIAFNQSDIFNANIEQSNVIDINNVFDNNAKIIQSENIFEETNYINQPTFDIDVAPTNENISSNVDIFDAFSVKFESTISKENNAFDAFGSSTTESCINDAWGQNSTGLPTANEDGFGADDSFDAFLTLNEPPPVPSGTPAPFGKGDSQESDDGTFNVFIKPKEGDVPSESLHNNSVPILAPPPKSPAQAFTDTSPRFNPFDKSANYAEAAFGAQPEINIQENEGTFKKSDSQETPPTPLFDDDVSQPLEDFPRIHYEGPGWEVQLRQPNKKKITGQRFWKKIFVKLVYQGDNPVVQLFNSSTDKEPFQELPLQACYSVSDIAAQQYDQYGKIFTIKLQYVFYKERPGVRPGQVTKAERITNKLSQFAAYAIQGDYQGVKEFGSDLKKLGLPVEHAPQVSQLFKIGSTNYEDMKQFSMCIEEALFRLNAHRDRALHYKMEEVQITAVDELYVEQSAEGHVLKQIARVRLFFLGFLSGMPDVELGANDMWRQGKEVVGRHDIIPVATEEWIRLEGVEFHSCVQPDEYQKTRIIKFKPPDACYIELMRFRVRPPKNRELPLQLKAVLCVTGNRVELRADVLVPGFTSRSLGQVPCEDVMIRFPIPECWIYLFRVEKHFRYGSVKSAHRRTGKIKGIERFLGAVDTLQESLIEVTSGQAKYEHQHRSIVWRMPRLPKEGQGAYTTHNLVCRMALTSYDQIPEKLAEWCYVEFTMPATQVSHTTVRSVSFQSHDSDEPPEKYVRYLARHEYKVGIEHAQGEGPNAYSAATITKTLREEPVKEMPTTPIAPSSDSDSD